MFAAMWGIQEGFDNEITSNKRVTKSKTKVLIPPYSANGPTITTKSVSNTFSQCQQLCARPLTWSSFISKFRQTFSFLPTSRRCHESSLNGAIAVVALAE